MAVGVRGRFVGMGAMGGCAFDDVRVAFFGRQALKGREHPPLARHHDAVGDCFEEAGEHLIFVRARFDAFELYEKFRRTPTPFPQGTPSPLRGRLWRGEGQGCVKVVAKEASIE